MPIIVLVLSTLGWPALQLAVFGLRSHQLPPGGVTDSLVFLPMGLVSGMIAAFLLYRAQSRRQRKFVILGYLLASPVAFVGSLMGGLVLAGFWAPLVYGGIPLGFGCFVGFFAGKTVEVAP